MIRVLQDWEEVGRAYASIERAGLPPHPHAPKNWDLDILRNLVECEPRSTPILDLGCGGLHTLRFLSVLGFTDLVGVDLELTPRERVTPFIDAVRARRYHLPFRVRTGDFLDGMFPESSFGWLTCISTVEHEVDEHRLAAEARRLLRPGGRLFLTTDYWEPRRAVEGDFRMYGLRWRIYARRDVEQLIDVFAATGLRLANPGGCIPACSKAPVTWSGYDYTFVCLVFERA